MKSRYSHHSTSRRTGRLSNGGRLLVAVVLAAWLPMLAHAQPARRVVHAAAYVDGDGKITKGGLIVIKDGVIKRVGGKAPGNAVVDRYEGAVVCPGLIDVNAALGAVGNLGETDSALQPEVQAKDAFDRFESRLRAALEAGVITFALVPDDQNLVGGRIAICQTAGAEGVPLILNADGPLKLSLSPDAFKYDREPTSRSGALAMLRKALKQAAAQPEGKDETLTALAAGKLPAIMTTPSGADVLAALELAAAHELKLTLVHNDDARGVATEVGRAGVGVIVGPYNLYSSPRDATAGAVLEEAGVDVAIAGELPVRSADSLRIGAAVAARNGLSLPAARKAITSIPAAMLGVGDRIGTIKQGYRADLVVFSGDPLDLRSRVLAVYVNGELVYRAEATAETKP